MTLLHTAGVASDGITPAKASYAHEIESYLAKVSFPSTFKGGMVTIRFTMDDQQHTENVVVYTDIKPLKEGITKGLVGKAINGYIPVSYQDKNRDVYVLRLHITLN